MNVPGPSDDIVSKITGVTGKWTSFTAFGSFCVYLLGYLALRFQLSAYGVATNLDVWDERYFFAGSRFLVYLVSSVPNVLLIVIVVWIAVFLLSRVLPVHLRSRITAGVQAWASQPNSLPLLGTLLAVALIQLVMRKCFVLGNLCSGRIFRRSSGLTGSCSPATRIALSTSVDWLEECFSPRLSFSVPLERAQSRPLFPKRSQACSRSW
jgi:hypothetical protein